ncbi:MAG: hypothetical protein ACREUL_07070 [Steroidobacteraceae bacterium]
MSIRRCPKIIADDAATEIRLMSYVRCLRGLLCGQEHPADRLLNLDPVDQRPVAMVLDLERLGREQPQLGWYHAT